MHACMYKAYLCERQHMACFIGTLHLIRVSAETQTHSHRLSTHHGHQNKAQMLCCHRHLRLKKTLYIPEHLVSKESEREVFPNDYSNRTYDSK